PTALPARQVFDMATRMGGRAVHLGDEIGSLEVGKRADLAVVDLGTLHNQPHFRRDPDAVYARLIYATKSTDVTDVMVNGRWLLRERDLLTLDPDALLKEAETYARKIDSYLIEREESLVSKLVTIGGAEQQESYEVQIKVRLDDPEPVIDLLESEEFEVIRTAHYLEYDTYFIFEDEDEGRLRYREDEFVDEDGEVFNVRYRLTLIGPAAEREFPNSVLLSRSRFIAEAQHSLRFYREYFKPEDELVINKDRLRWLIRYGEFEFFINVDRVTKPELDGAFLEVKTRTWSRRDAEQKAERISDLLADLGLKDPPTVKDEYPEIITD
ncbi:MAG: amidohydrolase family protein, partial [Anaerolineales bacterium]|nr:amidohydrolase family protein [Anaerolineales bacterium]